MSTSFDQSDFDDCFELLSRTISKASEMYAGERGLIQANDLEKRNERLLETNHIRQLKKLQKPVSRTTASIPHFFMLLWKGWKAGMRIEIRIPPTLLTVSKDMERIFMFTNAAGVVEAIEGQQATYAFFNTLSRRKARKQTPLTIHHTNIGSASLHFSRREARSALTSPYSFHFMQKYIDNKTQSPEILSVIWRPQKPAKFFFIVPRRCGSKPITPRKSEDSWILNRSDYGSTEILDCAQTDPSVLEQSNQIYSLLSAFGIKPITELITDYMRNKQGQWVFKSIVHVQVEEKSEKPEERPVTASAGSFARISLRSKIQQRSPKPRPSAFVSNTSLMGTVMSKAKKDELSFSAEKKLVDFREIEEKVRSIRMRKAPHMKLESLPGRKPQGYKSMSEIPNIEKLMIIDPEVLRGKKISHTQDEYETKISHTLKVVSDRYDTMQQYIKEFHDRRAHPKRCIYYYSDAFWRDISLYMTAKLQEDPKAFPYLYRIESSKLQTLISKLIERMKSDVLPLPVDISLLEICVELSLPRLDGAAFITLLRNAFQANKMREDELEVAVGVYRDNLQHLLNLNWKKSFSVFLTKRVMSNEFMEKVMLLRDTDQNTLQSQESQATDRPSFSILTL